MFIFQTARWTDLPIEEEGPLLGRLQAHQPASWACLPDSGDMHIIIRKMNSLLHSWRINIHGCDVTILIKTDAAISASELL